MEYRTAWYDLAVVKSFARVIRDQEPFEVATERLEVSLKALRIGYMLERDIQTPTGLLLVPAGTSLGLTHLEKLRALARLGGIREPIAVLVHAESMALGSPCGRFRVAVNNSQDR